MVWWAWLWIAIEVLGAVAKVALVGRPRQPLTAVDASMIVMALPFSIWFITWVAQR